MNKTERRSMTKKKFMVIDLTIFSILAGLSEFLSMFLFNFFNSGFYISFAIMISIITIIRWSYYGVVPLIVSGVVDLILNRYGVLGATTLDLWYSILFYVLTPLIILFVLFYTKTKNRDESIDTSFKFFIYILLCYGLLIAGKGIVILIVEHTLSGFGNYFLSVSLSLVISIIFLFIFKGKSELIRDMDSYIEEVQTEDEYERKRLKCEGQ